MARLILFLVLWLGCCGYALWRGGAPERIGAATFLVAAVASMAVQSPAGEHFRTVETGVLLIDAAVLAAFVWLSFTAERFWPLWMSAMQAVQVLSHMAIAINSHVLPWGYWNAQTLWSYPMLLLLAAATILHRRRIVALGSDPSWKRSSHR